MKERPILFSSEMVRAILDGKKTQTRRVIRNATGAFWDHRGYEPYVTWNGFVRWRECGSKINVLSDFAPNPHCPFGQVGDRLWVRETWKTEELEDGLDGVRFRADMGFRGIENSVSAADAWIESNFAGLGKWRPSIFMPRWASRITLEITCVRVEQIRDISNADAIAEGFQVDTEDFIPSLRFAAYWDQLNHKRGYGFDVNPYVWVIEFERIEPSPAEGDE